MISRIIEVHSVLDRRAATVKTKGETTERGASKFCVISMEISENDTIKVGSLLFPTLPGIVTIFFYASLPEHFYMYTKNRKQRWRLTLTKKNCAEKLRE